MTDRNIYAYTAPGSDSPDYLSINITNGDVVVTFRVNNRTSDFKLPPEEVTKLAYQIQGARRLNMRGSAP